ncbi:MAG: HAMP domain-containing sensor histidine kinase [Promethearchaeia archaeon]
MKKEKKMEKKKEFLDSASHELKTPLSQIYSAAQLLKESNLAGDKKELLDLILNGSEKLKYLLKNFFEYSRWDSNDNKFEKEEKDLIALIKKCKKDLQFFIEKRRHEIYLNLPEQMIVKFDNVKMEQVITNLLSNAIKYTPAQGEITVTVKEEKSENKDYVIFSVKDTGIGLTEGEMDKLFKKFTVLERGKSLNFDIYMKGTGLGLYLSKKIIELHDGKIWVESDGINKGSTFYVKLPRI